MSLTQTIVHEDGDKIYLIAPVSPVEPTAGQIEEYAFGKSLVQDAADRAPNPMIKWFAGHYVEADNPNGNGAMWTANEIALKSMTPRFMPVTVMHDPSTAVGLIADVALRTPEKDNVARAKLETVLGLWAHRFPEVIEEAVHNYEEGTLMQSMECLAPQYECAVCHLGFLKLPGGAEQANWCDHLKGAEGLTGVRILQATTFTGTGLIFGTRGARGADPLAHLEDFKQEVAEYHQRQVSPGPPRPRPRSKHRMEIEDSKYEELVARPSRDEYATVVAERDRAVQAQEASDAENLKLRGEVEAKDKEIASAKDEVAKASLRDERMGKLGTEFTAKLGETTVERLRKQASEMQDAEWAERITELAELTGVKSDSQAVTDPANGGGAPAPSGTPTFTAEEVAAQQVKGVLGDTSTETTMSRSVVGALIRPRTAKK